MIIFVAIHKKWAWSERFREFCVEHSINHLIIEPGVGRISLLLTNLLAFLHYLRFRITGRKVTVCVCFGSTNGYIWSFLSPRNYILFLLGTDCLSQRNRVKARTLRAIHYARKVYTSSPPEILPSKIYSSCRSKLQNNGHWWSPNIHDFLPEKISPVYPKKNITELHVGTIRHLNSQYLISDTFQLIDQLGKKFDITSVSTVVTKPDKDLQIPEVLANCRVQKIKHLSRQQFIFHLSTIDLAVSLTRSDFFGGPIIEAACVGCVVIVNDDHPILKLIPKNISIIGISQRDSFSHLLMTCRKERAQNAQNFFCHDGFRQQLSDIIGI